MKKNNRPRSLRGRLLTAVLLCWVLPVLSVMILATWLLGTSYERSARQELASRADNALEQLELRMNDLFEDSKSVSYDGVVRNSYRLYQRDGDNAALYRTVTEYLNQTFSRSETVSAAFLSFWEAEDVRPYTANRADSGYHAQQKYREELEPELLRQVAELDTKILLLEYEGDLYIARNLLDSHFRPYATVVLLCNQEQLFRSLTPISPVRAYSLRIDDRILRAEDGRLSETDPTAPEEENSFVFETETAGHRLVLTAFLEDFNYWRDIPQTRMAAGFVALLALPLLLLVFYLFRRHVTRPVETLVEASNRLQGGERGYTISETADSREFDRLYRHFNTMSEELDRQFERSLLEQQALQQAQVKALQLQINPHFLNNTLEIINWEARLAGDDRVSAMIEALSVMMDGALGRDGRSRVSLREELSYVDAYLYIIRERLGERLSVLQEIDETMLDTQVPRLILQPLAENAVEHDLSKHHGGQLTIRVYRNAERIVMEVEHDGVLSEEDREAAAAMLSSTVSDTEISGQVGLRNVRQRLALLYGDQGELSLTEPSAGRILARICFPIQD